MASKSWSTSIGAMFRRRPPGTPPMTRRLVVPDSGRSRSKSVELSLSLSDTNNAISDAAAAGGEEWSELRQVKSLAPVVACVLPLVSLDFATSCLLAVGATPDLVDEPADMEQHLTDCKAVVVDVSAPKELVEAFIEHFTPCQCPLVLLTWGVGTCDRKKTLARRVMEECSPVVISGRMGDISALSMDIMDRATGMLSDDDDDDEDEDEDKKKVLNSLTSPPHTSAKGRSGAVSPLRSPLHHSPRGSPMLIRKKKNAVQRKGTVLPAVLKKGQFRDRSMKEVTPDNALEMAGKLAAQSRSIVHLYETNTLTSGETILEINNTQLGMHKLHSTVQCAGCVLAAVLACIDDQGATITLQHCGHALSLFYVAAEEAGVATSEISGGVICPGTLRSHLLDQLNMLDERGVRVKAEIVTHHT